MKSSKFLCIFSLLCIGLITGCSNTQQPVVDISSTSEDITLPTVEKSTALQDIQNSIEYIVDKTNTDTILILFDENTITTTEPSIRIEDSTATITQSGNYELSGTLSNGKIVIDTQDEQAVTLILNGISVTNTTGSPLVIQSADQTVLVLEEGTTNTFTDGSTYSSMNDDEVNAALYSRDDLIIQGNGSLVVNANYNDGISGNDDVVIRSGSITINAVDDGIRGNDSLLIEGGAFEIIAGGDAIKTENDQEGIMQILGGDFILSAGDDAIHSEVSLLIEDGNFTILEAFEGIEAKEITINGGSYTITTTDDGFNAGGGGDDNKELGSGYRLTINDGEIYVSSDAGDSIDSNGVIEINGGRMIVIGAQRGGTSFDFVDDIVITGGEIFATGNGRREKPGSNASTQNILYIVLETPGISGEVVSVSDSVGAEIFSYTPEKGYSYFIVSSPMFTVGDTYTYQIGDRQPVEAVLQERVTRIQ